MTVSARAIQDGNESVCGADMRLNRAAWVGRRVRALGTDELSGSEDDDEDEGCLRQSSAHGVLGGAEPPAHSLGPLPELRHRRVGSSSALAGSRPFPGTTREIVHTPRRMAAGTVIDP